MAVYIVIRYTSGMAKEITTAEYQALAEMRYRIRKFVREGDAVARTAGLEPQQYLLLLALRGLPDGVEATIRTLADRLALKHHSAVELIDRMEVHGYVRRSRSRDDRRRVLVSLLPRGEKLLEQVARERHGTGGRHQRLAGKRPFIANGEGCGERLPERIGKKAWINFTEPICRATAKTSKPQAIIVRR